MTEDNVHDISDAKAKAGDAKAKAGRKPKAPKPASGAGSVIKYTDTWLAEWFAKTHVRKYRWVPERDKKGLITWSGTHWVNQTDDGPARYAAQQMIKGWAIAEGDDDAYACKARALSRRGLSDLVAVARDRSDMKVPLDILDADPYELNTPDGIVNLKTGVLLKHSDGKSAEHFCTKITAVSVDFEAPCPLWEKFLAETFAGNEELIDYMQQLFGVASIGEVLYHILPLLFGVGDNGKTVMLEVVRRILGTYAVTMTGTFLIAGRHDEHSAEMVKLVGARMAICSEVNEDSRFDEQKVKSLTGGEAQSGRYLYGQSFDFVPSHTLFLAANHQPTVKAGGHSIWRRLRQIPFNNVCPPEKKNEHLITELVDKEGPAILAWIVRGAKIVAGAGLDEPESVKAATDEYAQSEDVIGQFLQECTSDVRAGQPIGKKLTSAVWARYRDWCDGRGQEYKDITRFSKEVRTRGYRVEKSTGNKSYIFGIDLLAADEEDQ